MAKSSRIQRLVEGGVALMASPFLGLDLRNDPKAMRPGSVLLSQNFVPYNAQIFSKRKGTTFRNAVVWTDVLRASWATRYYVSSSVRKTIVAANKAAGDVIGQVDDANGDFTALTGMPGVGANTRWRGVVAGEVPKLYLGNNTGTEGILVTDDGVTVTQLAGTDIPAKGFPAGPYFDRLLCFTGKRVYYSRTNLFTDWTDPTTSNPQYLLLIGDEEIEAVFLPGPDRTEVGYNGRLYICTPTSTWVHQRDFDGSAGEPNSSFSKIHERAGVAGFNTVAWTDHGCVGMGVDNIWFFPVNGLPVPIGYEVESIIRDIPAAYRTRCTAIFYKGFYILSYVRAGETEPDRELWCDLRTFQPAYATSRSGIDTPAAVQGITWHGPMIREAIGIGAFVLRSQSPDSGELYGYGASEGRAMDLEASVYTDNGAHIVSKLTTADLVAGLTRQVQEGYVYSVYVHGSDTFDVSFLADEGYGSVAQTNTNTLDTGSALWDAATSLWDAVLWGEESMYVSEIDHWNPRPIANKIRLTVEHHSPLGLDIRDLGAVLHPLGRIGA